MRDLRERERKALIFLIGSKKVWIFLFPFSLALIGLWVLIFLGFGCGVIEHEEDRGKIHVGYVGTIRNMKKGKFVRFGQIWTGLKKGEVTMEMEMEMVGDWVGEEQQNYFSI